MVSCGDDDDDDEGGEGGEGQLSRKYFAAKSSSSTSFAVVS